MNKIIPLKNVRRVIIRMPNYLGDSIMATPAIELLRQEYPNAKFTFICRSFVRDIFEGRPDVEEVIIDNTKHTRNRTFAILKMIAALRKKHYDIGVLFQNNFLNALIFRLARITHVIGYNKEQRRFLLDFWLKIDRTRHYINHYANLINNYLGNKFLELPPLNIEISDKDILGVFEYDRPKIGLALGNEKQGSRAYPLRKSLELLEELASLNRFNLVLLGGEDDREQNKKYNKHISNYQAGTCKNLAGKTSVKELINIICNLDLLITIDSSPMHIAAAVRTPFIVILGRSTSPFCTVKPKVDFGIYIKKEKNLINDDLFINQIEPDHIVKHVLDALKHHHLYSKKGGGELANIHKNNFSTTTK